jgi:hypothetical protein
MSGYCMYACQPTDVLILARRNHGSRLVNDVANLSFEDNPRHGAIRVFT